MRYLSVRLLSLVEFTEHAYMRLEEVLRGIKEEEIYWHPVPEMNTACKILRHISRISFVLLPQVVEGTTRGDWDDDYEKREHSLSEMLDDIEAGKQRVLRDMRALKDEDLELVIPLWGGKHRRVEGLNMLIGELVYHAGQIALLRGAYRRAPRR
jgi:hypothetical protein